MQIFYALQNKTEQLCVSVSRSSKCASMTLYQGIYGTMILHLHLHCGTNGAKQT
jgi:hypothetical protein